MVSVCLWCVSIKIYEVCFGGVCVFVVCICFLHLRSLCGVSVCLWSVSISDILAVCVLGQCVFGLYLFKISETCVCCVSVYVVCIYFLISEVIWFGVCVSVLFIN